MTASGLPERCSNHAQVICSLALDMMEASEDVEIKGNKIKVCNIDWVVIAFKWLETEFQFEKKTWFFFFCFHKKCSGQFVFSFLVSILNFHDQLRSYVELKPWELSEVQILKITSTCFLKKNKSKSFLPISLQFLFVLKVTFGIHSGEVVGGVIGQRMPRYCLFGNAVNLTSRTETTGVKGKINVTEETYK